jgi:2-keto-4-pentenoate hydratase
MQQKQTAANNPGFLDIARSFVGARLAGQPLKTYPGVAPFTLEDAYRIQDAAISLWPEDVAGWKVGRITGKDEVKYGVDRLAGPIFKSAAKAARGPVDAQIFQSGFAAVEGEVVIILAADAPAEKIDWTTEETRRMIGSIAAGVEIASSPFGGINELGPLVTISDFGNNNGLILGDEFPDWRELNFQDWRCETFIDDVSVGRESPAAIPGGPIESLRFLLALCARRGLPLKKGMVVSTGAVTGVHEVTVGQSAVIVFNGVAPILCNLTAFAPADPANPKMRQSA